MGFQQTVTGGMGHSEGGARGKRGESGAVRNPWLSAAGVSDGVCGLKQGDEPGFGKSQFRECGRDTGAHVGRSAGQGQGGKRK